MNKLKNHLESKKFNKLNYFHYLLINDYANLFLSVDDYEGKFVNKINRDNKFKKYYFFSKLFVL